MVRDGVYLRSDDRVGRRDVPPQLPAVGVAGAARGAIPVPVPAAAAAAAGAPVAVTAAAVAVAAAPAGTVAAATHGRVTGADGGELLLGLAGDLGVLGEAQADAAALLIDLDHADG